MIELIDIPHINAWDINHDNIPPGLCRWFRVIKPADLWSIYYKSDSPEFLIEKGPQTTNFFIGGRLAKQANIPTRGYINYLGTLIWSVTREQFINAMIETNHCCLDWVLFHQNIWR